MIFVEEVKRQRVFKCYYENGPYHTRLAEVRATLSQTEKRTKDRQIMRFKVTAWSLHPIESATSSNQNTLFKKKVKHSNEIRNKVWPIDRFILNTLFMICVEMPFQNPTVLRDGFRIKYWQTSNPREVSSLPNKPSRANQIRLLPLALFRGTSLSSEDWHITSIITPCRISYKKLICITAVMMWRVFFISPI